MALKNIPTGENIIDRERADIKSILPDSNPYDPAGMPNALCVATGNRIKEQYDSMSTIVRDTYTATAEYEALLLKGLDWGLTPNDPSQSSGTIIAIGTIGNDVQVNSELQGQNSETYKTQVTKTIASNTVNIPSLTSVGTIATATFNSAHNLGSGMTLSIAGASESEYNGDFVITVISETVFQYTLLSSTTSPATGTITYSFDGVWIEALSDNASANTNISGGQTLSFSQTISGVESTVYTTFSGIDGGSDVESVESFRERIQLKQQNPSTPFNDVEITLKAREVSGVTRVWVIEADEINTSQSAVDITAISGYNSIEFTDDHDLFDGMRIEVTGANEPKFNGFFNCFIKDDKNIGYYLAGNSGTATGSIVVKYSNVQPGQVRVFFVRDGDLTITPSAQEVEAVKNSILEIKPAHTSDADVIVDAPLLKSVNFTFTTLIPNTSGLRTSIIQNLEDLFFTTEPGATITQDAYRTAIQNSFDVETKQGIQQFVLSTPTGDIDSKYNEIIALGDILFP